MHKTLARLSTDSLQAAVLFAAKSRQEADVPSTATPGATLEEIHVALTGRLSPSLSAPDGRHFACAVQANASRGFLLILAIASKRPPEQCAGRCLLTIRPAAAAARGVEEAEAGWPTRPLQ